MDQSPIKLNFEAGKFICPIQKKHSKFSKYGYTFHILQYFATKLSNFTKFRMLFSAVPMNFQLVSWFKI